MASPAHSVKQRGSYTKHARNNSVSGRPSIGNIHNPPQSDRENNIKIFLTRDQLEAKRKKQEEGLSELRQFLREYAIPPQALLSRKSFHDWLLLNGQLKRFENLWKEKIIFDQLFGRHLPQATSTDPLQFIEPLLSYLNRGNVTQGVDMGGIDAVVHTITQTAETYAVTGEIARRNEQTISASPQDLADNSAQQKTTQQDNASVVSPSAPQESPNSMTSAIQPASQTSPAEVKETTINTQPPQAVQSSPPQTVSPVTTAVPPESLTRQDTTLPYPETQPQSPSSVKDATVSQTASSASTSRPTPINAPPPSPSSLPHPQTSVLQQPTVPTQSEKAPVGAQTYVQVEQDKSPLSTRRTAVPIPQTETTSAIAPGEIPGKAQGAVAQNPTALENSKAEGVGTKTTNSTAPLHLTPLIVSPNRESTSQGDETKKNSSFLGRNRWSAPANEQVFRSMSPAQVLSTSLPWSEALKAYPMLGKLSGRTLQQFITTYKLEERFGTPRKKANLILSRLAWQRRQRQNPTQKTPPISSNSSQIGQHPGSGAKIIDFPKRNSQREESGSAHESTTTQPLSPSPTQNTSPNELRKKLTSEEQQMIEGYIAQAKSQSGEWYRAINRLTWKKEIPVINEDKTVLQQLILSKALQDYLNQIPDGEHRRAVLAYVLTLPLFSDLIIGVKDLVHLPQPSLSPEFLAKLDGFSLANPPLADKISKILPTTLSLAEAAPATKPLPQKNPTLFPGTGSEIFKLRNVGLKLIPRRQLVLVKGVQQTLQEVITITPGKLRITKIQLNMHYDPSLIHILDVTPVKITPGFFEYKKLLFKKVINAASGTITLSLPITTLRADMPNIPIFVITYFAQPVVELVKKQKQIPTVLTFLTTSFIAADKVQGNAIKTANSATIVLISQEVAADKNNEVFQNSDDGAGRRSFGWPQSEESIEESFILGSVAGEVANQAYTDRVVPRQEIPTFSNNSQRMRPNQPRLSSMGNGNGYTPPNSVPPLPHSRNNRRGTPGLGTLRSAISKGRFLLNPYVIIIIVIFFILVLILFKHGGNPFGDGTGVNGGGTSPVPQPTLTKSEVYNGSEVATGQDHKVGEDIEYAIHLSYPGTASEIIVRDATPVGATYKKADISTGIAPTSDANGVSWDIKNVTKAITDQVFHVWFTATTDNTFINNQATVDVSGGQALGGNNPQSFIHKTGSDTPDANGLITYTITVSYPGQANDITVTDHVPTNTTLQSAATTSPNSVSGDTVTWSLKALQQIKTSPSTFKSQTIIEVVKINAGIDNTTIVSLPATATVDGAVNNQPNPTGCSGGGSPIIPPNDQTFPANEYLGQYFPEATYQAFANQFTGQLHCPTAAGDENTFLSKIFNANIVPHTNEFETKLKQIYETTTKENVNPVIFVSAWGKESSYGTAPDTCSGFIENFNCGKVAGCVGGHDTSSDLTTSLTCSINLYKNREAEFNAQAQQNRGAASIPVVKGYNEDIPVIGANGSQINCRFADPFLYIIDIFTPTCHYFQENATVPIGIQEEQTLYQSYMDFYNKIINSK